MPDQDIATVLGAILALGLALQSGVGPTVMFLTEAIKDAAQPRSGLGGLISVFVGVALGVALGLLTALMTEGTGLGTYAAFGALAGLFMASGAIRSYKASAGVNTSGSAAIEVAKADAALSAGQAHAVALRRIDTEPAKPMVWSEADAVVDDGEENDFADDPTAPVTVYKPGEMPDGMGVVVAPVDDESPEERWRGEGDPPGVSRS